MPLINYIPSEEIYKYAKGSESAGDYKSAREFYFQLGDLIQAHQMTKLIKKDERNERLTQKFLEKIASE